MTELQKVDITRLRISGCSYSQIATKLNISENTVKSFCRRNRLKAADIKTVPDVKKSACECCGAELSLTDGKKRKRFCSDRCRNKWWNANLDKVNRRAYYDFTCGYCKKSFSAYGNRKRKYCCHECYAADKCKQGGGHI